MSYKDLLKTNGFLTKADVAAQDVSATEAEFQKAGASIVQKTKQEDGLFTVFGLKPDSQTGYSSRDYVSPQRQTVDKAMTSGR